MKIFKKISVLLILALLPVAAAAATFSTESNEVETEVIIDGETNANIPPAHAPKPAPAAAPEPAPPPPATPAIPAAGENANANTNTSPLSLPPPSNANVPPPSVPPAVSNEPPASSSSLGRVGRGAAAQVARVVSVVGASVESAVSAVNEQVVQNPQVQEANNKIVVPATTAATAAVAASVNFPSFIYFFYLLFLQPIALLDRRRGKRAGVVYNSLNKLPIDLALVRLVDHKTGRLVQTRITDRTGSVLFYASESEYNIKVSRYGFVFPAQSMKNIAVDPVYGDIYRGEPIAPHGEPIAPNIPLEPICVALTEKEMIKNRRSLFVKYFIVFGTAVLGFVSYAVSPNLWTGCNFVIQLAVLAMIERYVLRTGIKKTGRVVNAKGKPVPAAVRLFETTYNQLVETVLTDASGRFAFLVGPNKYYVVAEADGKTVKSDILNFSESKGEMVVGPSLKIL